MSEFLAEAQVLIRPDTTGFRPALIAQLAVATKGVTVPIPVTPVGVNTAELQALSVASNAAAAKQQMLGLETARTSKSLTDQERAARSAAQALGQARSGLLATTATMTGLRGAAIGASGPFLAAAISATVFAKAIQSAANLETELNVFRVTAGATAEEMERVAEQAKTLGRDLTLPGVTASDAAQTFLQLARAGLSVQESLDGARGVLQLAVAAELSFADAAQITASALNAFALGGEEAVSVADLLTNAANASQASIADMGIALRQSAAIADLAGFSLSETVTFLTQLARAGLAGSDAGTSFRVSIQRLIAPTAAAREALGRLNVNLRDAAGNLRPEAFFELGDALDKMGRAQADAARQTIFGNDASRAAAFFARINAQAFREQEKALERQGAAAEVAGARNAGFAGKIENLKNQTAALGIELGELTIGPLGVIVEGVALGFGLLAESIANTRDSMGDLKGSIEEDIASFAEFFQIVSEDSGFNDFIADVEQGAGVFKRGSDAVDDFIGSLLGLGGAGQTSEPSVRKLRQTENELAVEVTEANRRLSAQAFALKDVKTEADSTAGAISRLTGQIAGLKEGVTRARISGDEGQELELLEQERERIKRLLAIQEDIVAQGGRGAGTARRNIREQLLPELESINNEITAIMQEQVRRSGEIARDAEQARDERDRNILDALGARESQRRNAVIAAQSTASLQDDLRANIALRDFFRRSIVEIRKTVTDAKARAAAVASAASDLARAQEDVNQARADIAQALRDERREARERERESLALDIQLAETTGRRGAEVKAREAEIEFLQEQIRQTRKGSLQRKRLILELRQAQKELRDLSAEKKKTQDEQQSFAQMSFEFLQKQQGFAANLLGNLIPGFATGGLVGGTGGAGSDPPVSGGGGGTFGFIPPDAPLNALAAVKASRDQGVTPGQFGQLLGIQGRMLDVLERIAGGNRAPEARYQKAASGGAMDVM